MEPILPRPPSHLLEGRRPRVDARRTTEAILGVLRTGCHWSALNATGLGSHDTAHQMFQEWERADVFRQFWALALEEYDKRKGIAWQWRSMDGPMTRACWEEAQAIRWHADFKARRRVVERTHSWMNRFRRILTRKRRPLWPRSVSTAPSSHSVARAFSHEPTC